MKNMVKKLITDEQGAALILVLVVLLVGGLIAGGLLQHMGAGLLSGEVYNRRTAELYAADAGVEDAVWKIQHPGEAGLPGCGNTWSYTYPEPGEPPFVVNGKSIVVTIHHIGAGAYNVTSIAITLDGSDTAAIDSSTTVEAYVGANLLSSGFLKNAITSNSTVGIGSNSEVNGNILYGEGISGNSSQTVNGTATKGRLIWPGCDDLSNYYLNNVTAAPDVCNDTSCTIDVGSGTVTRGPIYRRGDLHIDGKGGTLKLTGTIYITGSLYCDQSGNGYTIDLNGQTIFVLGAAYFPANHVTVKGSGCIIACGYVDFQPGIMTNPDDFVFVMSVTGNLNFQPNGNFYGSVAGNVDVNLQPNNTLTWHSLGGTSLNVPASISGEMEIVTGATISSWEVTQQ